VIFGGRHIVFESPLSLEEATTRLEREITPPTVRSEWRRPMERRMFEKRPQSFIGTFADDRFHVVRLTRGRSSIRPWVDGTLSRSTRGCRVAVQLKMPTVALVAWTPFILLGVAAIFFVGGVFALWGLLVILAPGFVSNMEAQKAERLLANLFQSEPSRSSKERVPA